MDLPYIGNLQNTKIVCLLGFGKTVLPFFLHKEEKIIVDLFTEQGKCFNPILSIWEIGKGKGLRIKGKDDG